MSLVFWYRTELMDLNILDMFQSIAFSIPYGCSDDPIFKLDPKSFGQNPSSFPSLLPYYVVWQDIPDTFNKLPASHLESAIFPRGLVPFGGK